MKTALITGCAGAIGTALCHAFREAGYRVLGTDRTPSSAPDVFFALDLAAACSRPEGLRASLSEIRTASEGTLSVLVNNAAVQILGRTEEVTFDDWQTTLAVNVTAPLFLTQGLVPELGRNSGTVVNIGSVHARATKPRFVSYATSKAALVGLTRAMAIDLAPRVRVLAINPAAVDSPMLRAGFTDVDALRKLGQVHPLGRIATPDEIGRVVVFLASQDASFATGTCFDVDGGILSRLYDPE